MSEINKHSSAYLAVRYVPLVNSVIKPVWGYNKTLRLVMQKSYCDTYLFLLDVGDVPTFDNKY